MTGGAQGPSQFCTPDPAYPEIALTYPLPSGPTQAVGSTQAGVPGGPGPASRPSASARTRDCPQLVYAAPCSLNWALLPLLLLKYTELGPLCVHPRPELNAFCIHCHPAWALSELSVSTSSLGTVCAQPALRQPGVRQGRPVGG